MFLKIGHSYSLKHVLHFQNVSAAHNMDSLVGVPFKLKSVCKHYENFELFN